MKKKLTKREAALLRWKHEQWLKRPDTAIKLYKQQLAESAKWKTSAKVPLRIQKLVIDYYKALRYQAKSKSAKETYTNIIKAKLDRFYAYAKQASKKDAQKLQAQQVFSSYHYNHTERLWDREAKLKEWYPDEYQYLQLLYHGNKEAVYNDLKGKAIMEGKMKPLAQGEEYGYIIEEEGLIWSGD